jgi:glycosyltransferase involved in cell wall biosynthesis
MAARAGRDVCWSDAEATPLVTVRVATTGYREDLFTRALPSVLRQTYRRLEVIVVQDGPEPDLSARLAAIGDPRIRYHRLPEGGAYPERAERRWLVAGYHPMNVGNDLATGLWIAPCDDDDEFTDDHVAVLLEAARSRRLEFVHSRTAVALTPPSGWAVIGAPALLRGQVSHGAVLFAANLRFLRYSGTSWRRSQPFDFHLWRRMERAGVRMGFVDRITYRYFPAEFSRANYEREARRALAENSRRRARSTREGHGHH